MSTIRFIKRKEIDTQKWNECVTCSANSLPYAFSWYLDIVAENWDAVVSGDYETIMPIVWLRKFGIKCMYQPYYCQQLGAFGMDLDKKTQTEFLNFITKNFSYININLNPSAGIVSHEFKFNKKKNLLLSLNKNYGHLKKQYSENHRRNIQKAIKAGLIFSEEPEPKQFQKFYLENVNRNRERFKIKHEKIFIRLTQALVKNKTGKIFSVIGDSGKLLAASFIIPHQNRQINIINTSSEAGKKTGASHFLFDKLIEKYSDSDTILDFEGSSIVSIARFYEGFGAEEEIFYNYQSSVAGKLKQLFL